MNPLLSLQNVTRHYFGKALFEGINLQVDPGERLGVIGPNGTGKSTLLKVMAGIDPPDRGERVARRLLRIGVLPQVIPIDPALTVLADLELAGAEAGVEVAEVEGRAKMLLGKLGFGSPDARVGTLSGGFRKRLAFGRALMGDPELVLLDEPTNHLDLEGIELLESWLADAPFAYVAVTHDRAFLQATARRVVEIDRRYASGLFTAPGTYSDFLEAREAFLAAQNQRTESLANRVRNEVDWLRHGAKARTTKQQGRVQEANRLIQELEAAEALNVSGRVEIDFSGTGRRTKRLLVAEGLGVVRGERTLLSGLDLLLGPGMRLGLVGPNGSGKSSLLSVLAGELAADAGTVRRVEGLRLVHFEQGRETLDPELDLRRTLAGKGDTVIYQGRSIHVAGWAARFGLRSEQLDVAVGRLSGGEQAKILIARLMLQPADVLLLDEPTNDLDLPTLEVLEDSLLEFAGAVVLVTHDRFLMDRVSTLLLGLHGDGEAEYVADMGQWLARRAARTASARATERKAAPKPRPVRARKALTYGEEKEHAGLEAVIAEAEAERNAARAALEDPAAAANAAEVAARFARLQSAEARVETVYARWMELESKLQGTT